MNAMHISRLDEQLQIEPTIAHACERHRSCLLSGSLLEYEGAVSDARIRLPTSLAADRIRYVFGGPAL
jgi:hypothetical protein